MKLACSGTSFDRRLREGSLTQLEWLELCAIEIGADGVMPDVRDFPRLDTDYLAQIKKMTLDLGLTMAALSHGGLLSGDDAHAEQAFEIAIALGAPLIVAALPPDTADWAAFQERIADASSLAKKHNVTLAVRNAPHTVGASISDLKRVLKSADSAWLQFAVDLDAFDDSEDPQPALARSVIAIESVRAPGADRVRTLRAFRGFIAFDDAQGEADAAQMKNALAAWRSALFEANRS